jgi:hypothetical protein
MKKITDKFGGITKWAGAWLLIIFMTINRGRVKFKGVN